MLIFLHALLSTTTTFTTPITTVICSFTIPLFTVDNSKVILSDSSLIGHLSQTLVGINNAYYTFTNVAVIFDVKRDSKVESLNVKVTIDNDPL
ncbi:hypothetical protein P9112_008731 [Eukaryota sp. TZLM1-RC]